MERITVSIAEAGKALSISRTAIFALLKSGELERVKIGSRTVIPVASIYRLASNGTVVSPARGVIPMRRTTEFP